MCAVTQANKDRGTGKCEHTNRQLEVTLSFQQTTIACLNKSTLLLLFPFFLLLACPAPCRFSALQSLQQLPTPASFYLLSYIASFLHTIFFLRLFSCNCQSFLLLPLFLVPFSFYFLYLSWGSWLDWISVFIVH